MKHRNCESMDGHKELLRAVYYCDRCPSSFGFTRPAADAPYFKFPATIGAQGPASLLFVGINPRISADNRDLHERLMQSKTEFSKLAQNRDGNNPYIEHGCRERHYHWHVRMVRALFGEQAKFEDHAAVTELFLCATGNAKKLPVSESPCAKLYFERTFLKVRPILILPVWPSVLGYFQKIAKAPGEKCFQLTLGGHSALVAYLPDR